MSNLHDTRAERSFVATILSSKGMVLDQYPATEEHFLDPLALGIFRSANGLYRDGSPVENATVMQRIDKSVFELAGEFGVIDAFDYVSPAAAGMFFGELNDKLSLRRAADALSWASGELPTVKDVPAYCAQLHQRLATLSAEGDAENVRDSALDAIAVKIARFRAGTGNGAISSGLKIWDRSFGGLVEGQMYALASRPGMGKTAMLEMMVADAVSRGHNVTVFEKDMSPQKLMERLACRSAGLQFHRFARGVMNPRELDELETELKLWKKLPLRLYNPVSLTPDRMCAIARRDIRQFNSKAIFLDHVQALRVGKDIREGLTMASLSIRALVTETNVPAVILAHINRDGAEGRPRPENIKEFDQLYGDCDAMVLLWDGKDKGAKKEEPTPLRNVNFLVAKNRDGAVDTDETMLFDGPNLVFREKADEYHERILGE